MVGQLAQLRHFDAAIIDGAPLVPGSGAMIDQGVPARAFWPLAGAMLFRVG